MAFTTPVYENAPFFEIVEKNGECYFIPVLADVPKGAKVIKHKTGILWRLSANGYMDCTDWTPAADMATARKDCSDTYDVCADCGEDMGETDGFQCSNCKK